MGITGGTGKAGFWGSVSGAWDTMVYQHLEDGGRPEVNRTAIRTTAVLNCMFLSTPPC